MRKLISAAVVGTAVMLGALTARAQETTPGAPNKSETVQQVSPEKRALILELLKVTNAGGSAQQIFNVMSEQLEKEQIEIIWQSLKEVNSLSLEEKANLRDEIKASTERTGRRFRERLGQRLDFNKLLEEIGLELYAKYYTESEIKDLAVFYKSELGKKTLELVPMLLAESMSMTSERVMPLIKGLIDEMAKEEAPAFQKKVDELIRSHHRTPNKRNKSRTKGL